MPDRPDQENIDTLLLHGKQVGFGSSIVKTIWVGGMLTGWEEIETKRGHKAPLKKKERGGEA